MKFTKIISLFTLTVILLALAVSPTFAGGIEIATFAGGGDAAYKDGKATDAMFNQPYGLAVDLDGGLIVVDTYNNRIRKIKDGQVTTIAGYSKSNDAYGFPVGGYVDSNAARAMFNKPRAAVVDSKGNIYVADTGNNSIRKIAGGKVYTFAGTGVAGFSNGRGDTAKFNSPLGLAIDSSDNIYVADSLNHVIRKITPDGTVSTFAGVYSADGGYKDGLSLTALFNEPSDIDFDSSGALYVLDCGNQLVRKISGGRVTTVAGVRGEPLEGTAYSQGGFLNGPSASARFNFPKGIDVADDGSIFIADTWNHRIRAIKPDGNVVTVVGTGLAGKVNGALSIASLNAPSDVVYHSGTLYISDMWNNVIRSVTADIAALEGLVDRSELIRGIDFGPVTDEIQVWLDGEKVAFPDVKPYIADQKVYIPIRFVCEAWGADVGWVNDIKKVTIRKGDFYREFTPETSPIAFKDGRTVMDSLNLSREIGLRIEWFPEYNAVIITAH